MMKFALLTLAAAALFATASAASAQYYGPGFGVQIEPRYERDYDEPRYYRRDRDDYRNYDRRYRTRNGCPPRYTVQDGVCKPYRGY
jgi:Ni/Co efflux regulator RcnB